MQEPQVEPQASQQSTPKGRKRRIWRWLLAFLLVLAVGIALAPKWVAPLARGKAESTLAQAFGGKAKIGGLQMNWGGNLKVQDVALQDAQGQTMLHVEQLQAKANVMPALRGKYEVSGTLEGFEIHVRQQADGTWNWVPKETQAAEKDEKKSDPSSPTTLPELRANFQWSNGVLILHGPGGMSRFTGLHGELDWPGGGQSATLSASISDSHQEILSVQGTLQSGANLEIDGLHGNLVMDLTGLGTAAISALQDPNSTEPAPEGTLAGQVRLDLEAGQKLNAAGELHFAGSWPVPQGENAGETPTGQAPETETQKPVATRLEQKADLQFQISATPQTEDGSIAGVHCKVAKLRYESPTAALTVQGEFAMGTDADQLAADLQGTIQTQLQRLQDDLRPLMQFEELALSGALTGDFQIVGNGGRLRTGGNLDIRGLDLQAKLGEATQEGGKKDFHLRDPRLGLHWDVTLDSNDDMAFLHHINLESQVLSGDFNGGLHWIQAQDSVAEAIELLDLRGKWTYIPERLGELLGPWLPGELHGMEEREIDLEFAGLLADLEPWAILQGVQGKATIGLGQYTNLGFETSGVLTVENKGEAIKATGNLVANGGQVTLQSNLRLKASEPLEGQASPGETAPKGNTSTVSLSIESLRTNPKVSSMLSLVHPAFHAMDNGKAGDLTGLISANLDLSYDSLVQESWLQGDFSSIDWSQVQGSGRLQLMEASFANSPLVQQLVGLLGDKALTKISLKPIEFSIQNGRLQYSHPWDWTVEGAQTSFQGSVGLDRTLDLVWQVPITAGLIQKHKVLKPLLGEAIRLPIKGSIERPRLDIQGTLQELTKRALQKEAQNRLQDVIKDKVGGEVEQILDKGLEEGFQKGIEEILTGGMGQGKDDPQALLTEADRLYEAGQKGAAGGIYETLRTKHKLSLVYLLNKSRIKRRAKQ